MLVKASTSSSQITGILCYTMLYYKRSQLELCNTKHKYCCLSRASVMISVCTSMILCATSKATDLALCTGTRIDPDLCLTPYNTFHKMQLALWLISYQTDPLKCQHSGSPFGSLHGVLMTTTLGLKQMVELRKGLGYVCFSLRSVLMIRGCSSRSGNRVTGVREQQLACVQHFSNFSSDSRDTDEGSPALKTCNYKQTLLDPAVSCNMTATLFCSHLY